VISSNDLDSTRMPAPIIAVCPIDSRGDVVERVIEADRRYLKADNQGRRERPGQTDINSAQSAE